MRFVHAWAGIAAQNVSLKVGVGCLSLGIVALSFAATKLALRAPLVIERGCASRPVDFAQDKQRSTSEVEAFVREALPMRFSSVVTVNREFVSAGELKYREQEQQELNRREMSQRIIVNSVKVENGNALVDSDRLISVGKVRSALPFPVTVTVASVPRTEVNPYGLIIMNVSAKSGVEEKAK